MRTYKTALSILTFFLLLLACEDIPKTDNSELNVNPVPAREEIVPIIDDTLNIDPPSVLDTTLLIISKGINLDYPKINLSLDTVHSSYAINDGFFKPLPSEYEDKINSFYLPKGFLVVFAENSDGTGESACFVAIKSAIKAILPVRLQNKVSYVRYKAVNNPTKKGSANTNESTVIASEAEWYYSWGLTRPSFPNQKFVAMTWGKSSCTNKNVTYLVRRTDIDHLLSFNEPDSKGQSNVPVDTAIVRYKIMQKSGLRLGSPVTTQDQAFRTDGWLPKFMELATKENLRIDYITLHWYDWGNEKNNKQTDALTAEVVFKRFVAYVEWIRLWYPKKSIWITEFNANINRTSVEVHKIFMQLATNWMDTQVDIERYAYFFPSTLPEKDANNNLTELGAYWKEINSSESFKSNITGDAIIIE
jgi:Glycosyl hydrolase catalytic core